MGHRNKYKKTSSIGEIERLTLQNVPWHQKRLMREHEMRYEFALKYSRGKNVIDIACGSGFGTAIIAKLAKKVYGIDNDSTAIQYAQKNYKKKNCGFRIGDAQRLNISDKTIDVVVSFETIEHLPRPKNFLLEIKRILKENGTLILSTPNRDFSHGDNPFHLHEFTFSELQNNLIGFTNVEFYGQRPVNRILFSLYKNLEKQFPYAKKIFRFRPWEKIVIEKIKDHTNYLYFIVVCQKKLTNKK